MAKPILPSVLLLLALAVSPAAAQGQLYLSWEDCPLGGAGARDNQGVCLFNDGASELYCAFTVDQEVDDVVGLEVVVDLQHSDATLPAWWELKGAGDCRDGALTVSGDFTGAGTCVDPWRDLGAGEAMYFPGLPGGLPSQARIFGTYAIRSDSARTLVAGEMYYALKILIGNQRTTFPDACDGCAGPVCLVLNSIRLLRGPGSVPGTLPLEAAGPEDANRVTWKGGEGADCAAVPVRNRTWGQIKSFYR